MSIGGFWGTDRDLRKMKRALDCADKGIPTALLFNGREYNLPPREQAVNEALQQIEACSADLDPDGTR